MNITEKQVKQKLVSRHAGLIHVNRKSIMRLWNFDDK